MSDSETLRKLLHHYEMKALDCDDGRFADVVAALGEAIESLQKHGSPREARAQAALKKVLGEKGSDIEKLEISRETGGQG